MKTYRFKLYKSERNEKLNKQINAAGLIYSHCITLHKRKIFGTYLRNLFASRSRNNRQNRHIISAVFL